MKNKNDELEIIFHDNILRLKGCLINTHFVSIKSVSKIGHLKNKSFNAGKNTVRRCINYMVFNNTLSKDPFQVMAKYAFRILNLRTCVFKTTLSKQNLNLTHRFRNTESI